MTGDNPHDKLFQKTFSAPENARGMLRSLLPQGLVEAVDWSTLELQDGHFVDEALRGSQSDLLYSVRWDDKQVFLYLLFEHQSSAEPLMPLRMLRYMVRIWERWLAEQTDTPKQIPAIVPIVLSHADGGWRQAVAMHELFDPRVAEAAGKHLPEYRFVLEDLALKSDDDLMARAGTAMAILTTLLLRNVRSADDLKARMAG
ncbi:MAG: Rpn family recombination-promoting nuclease/putative transposase [Deltaproteobacteria bacterium]|nr:Rpn family recombination-promoting nuclease/putative transposase [Deltaproteobacteria bacterium]